MGVSIEVRGSKISPRTKQLLLQDATKFLRNTNARIVLYVKTLASKKLVKVHARLFAGRRRFFSTAEGHHKGVTCMSAVQNIGVQLSKKAESF